MNSENKARLCTIISIILLYFIGIGTGVAFVGMVFKEHAVWHGAIVWAWGWLGWFAGTILAWAVCRHYRLSLNETWWRDALIVASVNLFSIEFFFVFMAKGLSMMTAKAFIVSAIKAYILFTLSLKLIKKLSGHRSIAGDRA